MRPTIWRTIVALLAMIAVTAGASASAAAGATTAPISFSVTVAFTHHSSCPGPNCLGHGSAMPYGGASAVLDGAGFAFNTWVLTLTVPAGSVVLDVVVDDSVCTNPGRSGDIPRPPTSNDFGNPVTCGLSYTVAGGTGSFTNATGSLPGTFSFAGAVLTLGGGGHLSLG